jgi:stage V sporulation protein AF
MGAHRMISSRLDDNIAVLSEKLPVGRSFDLVTREMQFGKTRAYWVGINGMYDLSVTQMVMTNLQNPAFTTDSAIEDLTRYLSEKVGFAQTSLSNDWDVIVASIVSGPSVIFVDGFSEAVIMDLREYPMRSIEEPENEKVMKGAKDGFVETLLFNANLIRRRIRNLQLTFALTTIGTDTQTDIAIAYVGGIAEQTLVDAVTEALGQIHVSALTMGEKSLEELLVKKHWYNPMPSLQTTERPDVACSYLLEGNVLVLVDNTPMVLILPGTIFQFSQSPEDYYKNPLTGNLFRFLRFTSALLSLYLLPAFLVLAGHLPQLTQQFSFLTDTSIGPIDLLGYVLVAEFGLELLQYASAHALGTLTTPLSIIGGLVMGEIAINLNWFSEEVIFYTAVTLLSTLMIASHEFADALRIYRFLLILASGFFGVWGLIGGSVLMALSVITTPTFSGKSYFWPLIPMDWPALKTVLFRLPTPKVQSGKSGGTRH